MNKNNDQCIHAIISGRVQGVCFRASTVNEATRLGLTGWVRNLATGDVEAVFEGDAEKVAIMLRWCHRGPIAARVSVVKTLAREPDGRYSDFRAAPNANGPGTEVA